MRIVGGQCGYLRIIRHLPNMTRRLFFARRDEKRRRGGIFLALVHMDFGGEELGLPPGAALEGCSRVMEYDYICSLFQNHVSRRE